ncbi:hypothetical protein H058_00835 [Vibrio antiquarius]|nr:hypothetical protein H058_00835 [Vibrio antiquarius]
MKLPTHIVDIRENLHTDKITWREALQALQEATKKTKPWHRKEWKLERDSLIANSCTQCGAHGDTQPMVLQHLRHPRTIDVIFNQLASPELEKNAVERDAYIKELLENSDELNHFPIGEREGCPKCESTNVRFRKTRNEWDCLSKKSRGGRVVWRCGNSFETPLMLREPTPEQKRQISAISGALKKQAYEKYNTLAIRESYGKEAVLESIKDTERYLSFKDTTTYCKKCAYLMDVKGLIYCPEKQDYISIYEWRAKNS